MIRTSFAAALLFCLTFLQPAFAQEVTFDKQGDDIHVSIGGKPFSVYRTGKKWPKPFFQPVLIEGIDITRPIDPNEKEHKHHKGIWVAIDEVNEVDFWGEKSKIVNVSAETQNGDNCAGELHVVNHWLDPDGKPVVIEDTTIHIYPNRLMTYAITFKSPGHEVVFRDTKEGLLGFRMKHTMREKEGGRVLGANGKKGTKENWGKPNKWIDYVGEVEGKTFGVTLMDDPNNLRPSRYHVRDYGLFSISPFGDKAYTGGKEDAKPQTLAPGESLTLRYGIYFHTGDTEAGKVPAVFEQFLNAGK